VSDPVCCAVGGAEQHDGRPWDSRSEMGERFDPVEHRHVDVEHDHVWPQGCRLAHRLTSVRCLPHDRQVGLVVKHGTHDLADRRCVVDDENAPLTS